MLRRGGFHHYDLWMLVVRLFTGVMTAIVRLFITIAVALLTLTRADVSPLPAWIERYLLLDTGSKSFQATVKACHQFNNPIFRVACWVLVEDSQRRRKATGKLRSGMATVQQLCGKIKSCDDEEMQSVTSEVKYNNEADTLTEITSKEENANDEPDSPKTAKEVEQKKDTQITVRSRRHSGLGVLRWRLAIMLHRFPHLQYYRAHYLARKGAKEPHVWKTVSVRAAQESLTGQVEDLSSMLEVTSF